MTDIETAFEPDAGDDDAADVAPLTVALYVHVPFCLSKCAYCDFVSAVSDDRWHAPFVDAILFSASHWASFGLLEDVPTLYFGGGTPTILGDELVRLVSGLRQIVELRDDAEITVETNPDTTTPALIADLVAAGVNRFSLGIQSFDDDVLSTLGRRHDAESARDAAAALAASGVPFSVDLICGVPGQSDDSWARSLAEAVRTGAGHVSVYPLTVEEGTPLAAAVAAGTVAEPDSDAAAAMMLAAQSALAQAGIERYEVANYARVGSEARHNTVYWTGGAYLGLGPSASSMLPATAYGQVAAAEGWPDADAGSDADCAPAARVRFTTTADTTAFLRRPLGAPSEVESLSAEETAREDVMLGMRLSQGVCATQVEAAGLLPVMESLADDGLVERVATDTDRWRTTSRGWLMGNVVFGRLWAGE